MSHEDAVARLIERTEVPCTRTSLVADLRALGVDEGMTLLVHSSLSALGWVCGGSVAVVQALMDVLTPAGTLVMPAHSMDLSDPAEWRHPAVPADWVPVIRATMPTYDPRITPTYLMGRTVETFRAWPGVARSAHPHHSFAAWGRHAALVTNGHTLDNSLGEGSPLARLYELDASVLLLGVGYDNNTSFHLAEYRVPGAEQTREGAPILKDGRRVWVTFQNIALDVDPFPAIGTAFEAQSMVQRGRVGAGEARLFRQRPAVDFATAWLRDAQ